MDKTIQKIAVIVIAAAMFIGILAIMAGCGNVSNYSPGEAPQFFDEQYFFLHVGETAKLNIKQIFKHSGIEISSYELFVMNRPLGIGGITPMPAETDKDTITTHFAGIAEIGVSLYEKSTKTIYSAQVARVYITDESNMTEIKTADDLVAVNNNLNGNYILKADINLNGIAWQSIGKFKGFFINKGGYKIRNLNNSALFNDNLGYIDGLILENVFINRVNDGSIVVSEGTIASTNEGMIANCSVNGTVVSNMFVGGITGYNIGRIVNCTFSGIVKNISNKTAEEILNDPDAPGDAAGGIAGLSGGTIVNCTASGQISSSLIAGGIVGIDHTAHYRGKGVINSKFIFLPELHDRLIAPIWGDIIGWKRTLVNRN